MAVMQQNAPIKVQYTYQYNTKNQSFIDMYHFLKLKGIKNNNFMLILYDSDLLGVDPRDPNLSFHMKRKVLAECIRNYWYFIREVVQIPTQGGEVGGGVRYILNRANLAMNFGFILNWNLFVEIPRQIGKTVSAMCWYLWVFLFGTRNSRILLLHKKLEGSKDNLQTLKNLRDALPDYLRMNAEYGADGKKLSRGGNSAESLSNKLNNNHIKTAPSARNKMLASNLGRGATMPFLYYDEYGWMPFNYVVYAAAGPAFSTAARNARKFGAPYGILITTTPGDMATAEGKEAFATKEMATRFNEQWYDCTAQQLEEIRKANTKTDFIYICFNYKQLGRTEEYFEEMVRILKSDWTSIRREVLLEWAAGSDNSPFEKQDLETVKQLIKTPIREIWIGKPVYSFKIYKQGNFYKYPPIIGVDVAGGLSRDFSAITIIDTETTEVLATFKCNFIPVIDLAKVIHELVITRMPNAVVNVERNGIGHGVLSYLISQPNIKSNLYYEIKDRVFEERFDQYGKSIRNTKKVREYGTNQTKDTRLRLMEILSERMRYHKDKFNSEEIYEELLTLEVKKNGKIEHCEGGHDDLIFSYLLALYVWYEGTNLMERYRINKSELRTDEEFVADDIIYSEANLVNLNAELVMEDETDGTVNIKKDLDKLNAPVMTHTQFIKKQEQEDEEKLQELLNENPLARKAYCKKYHIEESDINNGMVDMSRHMIRFYINTDINEDTRSDLQKQFDSIGDIR